MPLPRLLLVAVSCVVSSAVLACGGGGATGSAARPGQTGTSYLVQVSRPTGGTITSSDGRIACGAAPAASACGPVSYAWGVEATLTATADPGFMFGTWAGDCSGRKPCALGTAPSGADKYVVAVFGPPGRTPHENFNDPLLHGPEFLAWAAHRADSFECAYCHGGTYGGVGIAPSCNECHANAGSPGWQTKCTFCHGAPPANGKHPAVSSDLTTCEMCHASTVDGSGAIVAGGTHMDGVVEATGGGHSEGFGEPSVHAPEFFAAVAEGGGAECQGCHGSTYAAPIASGESCNGCHERAGWTGWQTNCSFCHGATTAEARAGYAFADHPDRAAPSTGAHRAHLAASALSGPFECGTCHAVPSELTHIGGRNVRAAVALAGAGQAGLPADLGTYVAAAGTCTTYCHGGSPSPAWSTTGIGCGSCHAMPPAAPHPAVPGAPTGCATCHSATVKADGSIDVAAGKHVNGATDVTVAAGTSCTTCHATIAPGGGVAASLHDPMFGTPGSGEQTTCWSCHDSASHDASHFSGDPALLGRAAVDDACLSCHRAGRAVAGEPITLTETTITRRGNFLLDGYVVGGTVTVSGASNPSNDRSYVIAEITHIEPDRIDPSNVTSVVFSSAGTIGAAFKPGDVTHVLGDFEKYGYVAGGTVTTWVNAAGRPNSTTYAIASVSPGVLTLEPGPAPANLSGQYTFISGYSGSVLKIASGTMIPESSSGIRLSSGARGQTLHDASTAKVPPLLLGWTDLDSDTVSGDFHGGRRGTCYLPDHATEVCAPEATPTGFGGTLLPPYYRGYPAIGCQVCHSGHASRNAFLLASKVNGRAVPPGSIDRAGVGAQHLCSTCHAGSRHDYCASCHGQDPAPDGSACFYCHGHEGITQMQNTAPSELPDHYNDANTDLNCAHCHGRPTYVSTWTWPGGLVLPEPEAVPPTVNASGGMSPIPDHVDEAAILPYPRIPLTPGEAVVFGVRRTAASIYWATDEASTAFVEYGVGSPSAIVGFSPFAPYNPTRDAPSTWDAYRHRIDLTGLTPGTTYVFRVRSSDSLRNVTVGPVQTFTTLP